MGIAENYLKVRDSLPKEVTLVVACKKRSSEEVLEAISAGATDLGENYVQEAEDMKSTLGEEAKKVKWHFIGKLQKNKVNRALKAFDVIQTIDSLKLAKAVSKRAEKPVSVLIEINIGSEFTKSGVEPDFENVKELAVEISKLENLKLEGLMTMGPRFGNPEDSRPFFKKTKEIFEKLKALEIPGVEMKTLSMGMSNSYQVAVEEGSNIVRVGTAIFGERSY